MGQPSSPHYSHSLDLLRRFVPTPLRARFCAKSFHVTVETNDFGLFPALPFDSEGQKNLGQNFQWKLVRDSDVTGPLEDPVFVNSAGMRSAWMGPACLFGLDLERRELVGFIGASVEALTYREFLVPLLLQMCDEALTSGPVTNSVEPMEKAANA